MVINNKRGWMRILEATIAVLIVSSVMVVVYSGHVDRDSGYDSYISNLEMKVLMDISSDKVLRTLILGGDLSELETINLNLRDKIPTAFNYSLVVCDLGEPCKLDSDTFIETYGSDVYVEDRIISANVTYYNPKKVRLFIWEI
ncbi:MAG: hypothetical protein ABIF88_01565 [archaeon]